MKSPLINVMERAARRAARGLLRDFGELQHLQRSRKGPGDFVNAADVRAEAGIRADLLAARPDYGLLCRPSGLVARGDGRHRWIVDPLDGTSNFMHGLPCFAVSIGLEQDGDIFAGLIYEPVRDEMFWGERNHGAFLNRRRLRVSNRSDLSGALIGTGIPVQGQPAPGTGKTGTGKTGTGETVAAVAARTAGLRCLGAVAMDLACVAAGRLDGFWAHNLHPWAIAAGICIVREAGGLVTTEKGGREVRSGRSIVAANPDIHPSLTALLARQNVC